MNPAQMLNYTIESSIVLLVLYAYYLFFLKKESWYHVNRFYLLITLLTAICIPLIEIKVFSNAIPLGIMGASLEPTNIVAISNSSFSFSIFDGIFCIYLIGVAISFCVALIRLWKLFRYIRKSRIVHKASAYTLFYTGGAIKTSSVFKYIFWDESLVLSPVQEDQLLKHEISHVKGYHSYDILFVQLIQILLWFHPLVYLIRRDLIQTHEFIADREAVKQSDFHTYIELLLSQMFGRQLTYTHSFNQSPLKNRIMMLNKQSVRRLAILKYSVLIPLVLGLGFMLSCTSNDMTKESLAQLSVEPAIDAYIATDQEPEPLNLQEIRKAIGYPKELAENGIEGQVVVRVLVGIAGEYIKHEIVASPHEELSQIISDKIASLKMKPATKDGKAVKFWVNIPFNFKLLN